MEKALADKNSVFYTYQALIKLRKELAVLADGDYTDLLPNEPFIWAYQRKTETQTLTVVANLSNQTQSLPFKPKGEIIMANEISEKDGRILAPYQAVYYLQK